MTDLVDCGECRTQGCPAGKCRNAAESAAPANHNMRLAAEPPILVDQKTFDHLTHRTAGPTSEPVATLRAALERIERWFGEFPATGQKWGDGEPMSYGAAFGSNGERDFMREVARAALAAVQPVAPEKPACKLTECQGLPTCRKCAVREPVTGNPAAVDALLYYREHCTGAEPSISVFHKMLDEALVAAPLEGTTPCK